MPNGFDGSIEDWHRMEAPLLEIDEQLAEFALERDAQVIKNYHNWPRRHIEWVSCGIHRTIQILVADKSKMTFHVAAVAWKDEDDERYFRDQWFKKGAPWFEIEKDLHHLLNQGFKTLESWSEKDLIPSEQFKTEQKSRKP